MPASASSNILPDVASSARHMVRRASKGALATLDAETGGPYASLVLLATTLGGAPITLLSGLARHTRNLHKSAAASLLIDTSNPAGDAESGGRITLMGHLRLDPSANLRHRFLARHLAAKTYVDLGDFAFFRFSTENALFIENFGRIVPLPAEALRPPDPALVSKFATAELDYLADLQKRWPMVTGFDFEGVDVLDQGLANRLPFPALASTPAAARAAAVECLEAYRTAQ